MIVQLCELEIGYKGRVTNLLSDGLSRRRMLDLGIVPGAEIVALRKSPLGDPIAYKVKEAVIALRKEESSKILVQVIDK
ncbi:FeoA family protein [Tepidibacter formicigenes]|jgi:ferrous iron transport protein A|uniref:Ferrous iron transport protein A n=1 Tax=Tepidibacter formicigenes DSM 15518 TaxID=1123349 RepID=A0A1M6JKU7_9FIRM|nr:FeoA family protein [Tepidibacter formicigenes]SHJ47293.1 ferrous iron transport protein A [Tepidibacter formicigenes DSM 15518]